MLSSSRPKLRWNTANPLVSGNRMLRTGSECLGSSGRTKSCCTIPRIDISEHFSGVNLWMPHGLIKLLYPHRPSMCGWQRPHLSTAYKDETWLQRGTWPPKPCSTILVRFFKLGKVTQLPSHNPHLIARCNGGVE